MERSELCLHIQFSTTARESSRVMVLDSPCGHGQEVNLDLDVESLWRGSRYRFLDAEAQSEHRNVVTQGSKGGASLHPQQLGNLLFHAVFQRGIRSCLEAGLSLAHEIGKPLFLRLSFDLGEAAGRKLAALPWELIYHHERHSFLARDRSCSLGRQVEGISAPRRQPPPYPLRIAVLVSQPQGMPGLQLHLEHLYVEEAWKERHGVELSFRPANREGLLDLLRKDFHVLHFMGHAEFCSMSGHGTLVFEDEDNQPMPVEGTTLAQMILGHPTLRLVVLNACRTGEVPVGEQADAFTGVATALVQGGLPAVIAMAFPVSDRGALLFSRFLYRSLADGKSLSTAVTEGRLGVFTGAPATWEWAVPVLMHQAFDGSLFEPARDDEVPENARRFFDEGCRWFYRGDFQAAKASFKEARDLAGAYPEAELYSCLCVLSICRPSSLHPTIADEVDRRLNLLLRSDSPAIAEPARLALGILRHDFHAPRRIQTSGADSQKLFAELEKSCPSQRARRLLASVPKSTSVEDRFHLGDPHPSPKEQS